MKITEATEIMVDLASQQWGLVTTAQATNAGVPAVMLGRLVDKSILERVRSGVYVSTSAGWSSATEIRAQWLALEPKTMAAERLQPHPMAVVSHESAAELHRIGDLDSPHICFTVPSRRQTRQPEVTFRIAELAEADWTVVDGLPVTTAVRTLTDLARAGHEPEHLTDMVGDILKRRLATRAEVTDALVDVAEILAISPATPAGAQAWLEERFPTPDPSPHTMAGLQKSMEKALAPIQEQLQSVLDAINTSPAFQQSLSQIADDTAHHPALRKAVADIAEANTSILDGLPTHLFSGSAHRGAQDNEDIQDKAPDKADE